MFLILIGEFMDHANAVAERIEHRVSPACGENRGGLLVHVFIRLGKESSELSLWRCGEFLHGDEEAHLAALLLLFYMSPEQARGQLVDARTDLFSLGTVLYQMATGTLPFQGDTSAVIFDAILNRDPAPAVQVNPGLPPEFARILDKALEKDRNLRCQTATELKTDLNRLKRDLDSGHKRAAENSDSRAGAAKQSAKSVAVLYFENISGVKEDEYFRDGITEDIITELSKIKGLNIFSRPTVLAYRDKQVTAAQIGQQLRAGYVLAGSLRRAGNRLRINAQLVDTHTDFPLWSER
jgi:TolB-like protein